MPVIRSAYNKLQGSEIKYLFEVILTRLSNTFMLELFMLKSISWTKGQQVIMTLHYNQKKLRGYFILKYTPEGSDILIFKV